jgi:HEAT repeat protein
LSWCVILPMWGSVAGVLWAEAKPKDNYSVRPSSQTIKRREAALALGQAKDAAQAGPQLLEALSDKDPMTRSLAVQSLGSLKYAAAKSKLAELLTTDPSTEVREAAAVSLRQLGDPQVVGALGKAVNDPAPNVRVTALMGLSYYRDAKVRPVVEAATKDKSVEVRRTAIYVLGRLGDPAAVPVVRTLLKDADSTVRAGAAQSLGELHAMDAKADLSPLLKDPEKTVQASTARALLMLGDSAGFETAKALSNDENLTVRLLAIDALGWSKDPAAEVQLQSLLAEAPANSRTAVREALTRTQQLRKR